MTVATVIAPDGAVDTISLPIDTDESVKRLQEIIGGYIEGVPLPEGRYMIFNENGKDKPHCINEMATSIAREAESIQADDYIAGVAVVLPAEVLI